MGTRLAACLVLAGTFVTSPVLARQTARLVYTRSAEAERCPNEQDLRSAISTRLGYDPFEEGAPAVVTAAVGRSQSTQQLETTVRFNDAYGRPKGEKRLASSRDDCVELASAMALSISILLDPRSLITSGPHDEKELTPPTPPDPHESPFATETEPRGPVRATPPPPVEPWRLRVGLESVGSVGAAPAPAIGLGAFLGVGHGSLSLDAEARADLPASLERADRTGVRSSLILGTIAPCGHVGVLALCALASAGALHGEGVNVATRARDTTVYAAMGARAGIELDVRQGIFLRLHADALFPLTQTTLKIQGIEYWASPPLTGALALGVGGRFW